MNVMISIDSYNLEMISTVCYCILFTITFSQIHVI